MAKWPSLVCISLALHSIGYALNNNGTQVSTPILSRWQTKRRTDTVYLCFHSVFKFRNNPYFRKAVTETAKVNFGYTPPEPLNHKYPFLSLCDREAFAGLARRGRRLVFPSLFIPLVNDFQIFIWHSLLFWYVYDNWLPITKSPIR